MIRTSESIQDLLKALVEAAPDITSVQKSKEAKSAKFTYRYATLDSIIDILRGVLPRHGMWFMQMPETRDGAMFLVTRVYHTSGQWIEVEFAFDKTEIAGGGVDAQKIGASITYFRRYVLASIFGIASDEDTDGVPPTVQPRTQDAVQKNTNSTEKRDPLPFIAQCMARMMKNGDTKDDILKSFADILKTDEIRSPEKMRPEEKQILARELWKMYGTPIKEVR